MRTRLIILLLLIESMWAFTSKIWTGDARLGLLGRRMRLWSSWQVAVLDEELMDSLNAVAPSPSTVLHRMVSPVEELEKGLVLQRSKETGSLELAWGKDAQNVGRETPFSIDFASKNMQRRHKEHRSELVVKAMGKPDVILDFTAGLGRDASLCATAGTPVILLERNWVIFQLLRDAVVRLSEVNRDLAQRMNVIHLDSGNSPVEEMERMITECGIPLHNSRSVYLDPMYPPDKVGRKSAVKKETQILHRVVGQSEGGGEEALNEAAMLKQALEIATERVVVKRPIKSDSILLEDSRIFNPTSSLPGSTHRFDIYAV